MSLAFLFVHRVTACVSMRATKIPRSQSMLFPTSDRAQSMIDAVQHFMRDKVLPAEAEIDSFQRISHWQISPVLEALKAQAKTQGLWNLFLPAVSGLSNLEYASLAEIMGQSLVGSEVFNCSAPDTGNMEVLHLFGSEMQQRRWLAPLLNGEIRSAFAMTEPGVASSDATNIQLQIRRDGAHYCINGKKWWTSGAMDPRCQIMIVMGQTNPEAPVHQRQSMILVPRETPGVEIIRPLTVFGFDDAPHGHAEVHFHDVRVPVDHLILGEGRGFEIAQARLGPGRIHHCMRLIGLAERALNLAVQRARSRIAFGKPIASLGMAQEAIARSRCEIDQARLLTLHAAAKIDQGGAKFAKKEIAMIKIVAPQMACQVIDRAMQIHGGMGLSQDTFLAHAYAAARSLRLADGPDEVHLSALAKTEIGSFATS
jgi:acyl-CoA dehydrogenase